MEVLINFVKEIYPLSNEGFQKLLSISEIVSYKAGDHLCELGSVNDRIFFILNGVTRTYMKETPESSEINKSICFTGNLATSLKSAINKSPANIACQCLTDCLIVETKEEDLSRLRQESQEFSEFMYRTLEVEYTKLEESLIDLLSKNATERYLVLREKIKDIDQLIPQYHIASHLGITPIQLSRIRKKLLNK
ncbi:Crp/Fnr family transcriptional regulator [Wenyingzhuangia sp. 2_MG-2023]|uniref:Crp/Fnr family transcriptional regulator n=1 Tax=Wenyingzhuangia sp. 2_MG-2023 TaxID=3062639 RepID=UPI0026E125C7|nr:Crp/Fnr family transcriptional regulator [Wenyingzhuangia sp. 2_MG-2023]MDO6737857.1 Crp/Fnr family transcriptional regulator [Wenyingzhuangia sp. 2_MG-2023]MDO6802140.1 Crp/Fnr family transcriptional regulator [Wenyingzhuangia sp. 1_MG-2023]